MRCRPGRMLLALTLNLAAAHAAPSLFDPRVTIDVQETRLGDVLAAISRQTGQIFDTPLEMLERRMQDQRQAGGRAEPVPDLAAVRERTNPLVTLQVVDVPVAEAIAQLSEQCGFSFRTDNGVTWRISGRAPRSGAAPPPGTQVVAGDYLVSLASLRLERSHDVMFGEPLLSRAQERFGATLRIEAPGELARYAVTGLGPSAEAELDGQLLTPASPMPVQPVPLPQATRPAVGYRLEFELPEVPGEYLDRLAGSLSVLSDLRELVFGFESLQPHEQRQTDGDVDVTVAAGPEQVMEPGGRPRRRELGRPVVVTVSRPVAGLASALAAGPGSGLLRARGGADMVFARPPDVPFEPGAGMGLNTPRLIGRAGASPALLPKVAFEDADGALHLAEAQEVNYETRADRVEVTCRTMMSEVVGEPRIWVAVLDASGETTEVPFTIHDVVIPAAEAPPPR